MRRAILVLEDGETFEGEAFGADANALGEVVFNTGMTGYQEILTDPSYDGQIVTMTSPHVGNYGVNDADLESARPRVAGFVIRDLTSAWSSWRGKGSLHEYLITWDVPGITEIDTRRLTRHLRERGAMRGAFSSVLSREEVLEKVRALPSMSGADLVGNVSTSEPFDWPCPNPRFSVAAYDFGIKYNILRLLADHGCAVRVYPAATSPEALLDAAPDGVFLSNGPGDPEATKRGIEVAGALIGKKPLFGICLGHQLLALAVGLTTYKLRFGHRGLNHPVARLRDGAIEITTQNHGFAVSGNHFDLDSEMRPGDALPVGAVAATRYGGAELTHLNLNDHTVEGFRLIDEPVLAVQYHPEAGPGPHDARYLFKDFVSLMEGGGHG